VLSGGGGGVGIDPPPIILYSLLVWLVVVVNKNYYFKMSNFFRASLQSSDPGVNFRHELGRSLYILQHTLSPISPSKATHRPSIVFING
jgi:hypothetical protein